MDYRDLERNEEQYSALFHALGYKLIHHGQGFYYFEGRNYLSTQRLQAITLFTLILFQDLEDKKFQEPERAWERNLLGRIFRIAELPHFETSKRRSMLHSVNVTQETLHEKVFKPMIRYGMLEMVGPDQFHFRAPIYRFVELCMQLAQKENEKNGRTDPQEDGGMNSEVRLAGEEQLPDTR
ncbi:MAG: hypothetical protein AB7G28_19715 [Pirellulales bacterium]